MAASRFRLYDAFARLLPSIALLLAFLNVDSAQAAALFRPSDRDLRMRHEGQVSTIVNSDDVLLSCAYRYSIIPRRGVGVSGTFYLRPYEKAVFVPLRPRVLLQLHERRYAGSFMIDKEQVVLRWLALFAGAGAGYTFADFDGSTRAPREGGTVLGEVGLCTRILAGGSTTIVRLAYRYLDLRDSEKNWFCAGVGVRL